MTELELVVFLADKDIARLADNFPASDFYLPPRRLLPPRRAANNAPISTSFIWPLASRRFNTFGIRKSSGNGQVRPYSSKSD
jgi:hypothetical protein